MQLLKPQTDKKGFLVAISVFYINTKYHINGHPYYIKHL